MWWDFRIENSRAAFVDQAQDQGIKAVRSGAGRDDHDQHEGIEDLGQIEPIVDPVCFIDRLVDSNSPLALYFTGPEPGDLDNVIATWKAGYFRPERSILVPNEYLVPQIGPCPVRLVPY